MKLRHNLVVLALAAAAALSGCGGAPSVPVAFTTLDPAATSSLIEGHEHGPLQQALLAAWSRVIKAYDRDHDGYISAAEMPWAPATFRELDRDGDGRLAPGELQLDPARLVQMAQLVHDAFKPVFKRADANSDGRLSQKELDVTAELQVFRNSSSWSVAAQPLTKEGFESYIAGLMQRTDDQRLNEPPLHNLGGKTPVLVVQGYMEPSWYFMSGVYLYLKQKQWPVFAIDLFPNIGDITEEAKLLQIKIDEILKETGARRVNLVVHSMGGLISRYYIQQLGGMKTVDRLVTIATPHYGTYVALAGIGEGARQMQPGSRFLQELNSNGTIYPPVRYTSVWSPTDEIVVPAESAQLNGSDVRPPVVATEHLLILFAKRTFDEVWAAINHG